MSKRGMPLPQLTPPDSRLASASRLQQPGQSQTTEERRRPLPLLRPPPMPEPGRPGSPRARSSARSSKSSELGAMGQSRSPARKRSHTPPPPPPTELEENGPRNDEDEEPKSFCAANTLLINVLVSILLIPVIILFFYNLKPVINGVYGFVEDHGAICMLAGFFAKLMSKIVLSLAFMPVGTVYKFVSANVFEDPMVASLVYGLISGIVETLSLVFHRRFTTIPESMMNSDAFGEKVQALRKGTEAVKAAQHTEDSWRENFTKITEIYSIQNAPGVPDTGTMLFYALSTDYHWWIFSIATFLSYMTIGAAKNFVWMVALSKTDDLINADDPWEALSNVQNDLPVGWQIFLYCVMGVSALFALKKLYQLLWSKVKQKCCREMPDADEDLKTRPKVHP